MTLVATPAASTANAFLDVAGADALAADDLGPEADAWEALQNGTPADLAKKEAALKRATREINDYLRSGWGLFDAAAQRISGLIFPRSIDTDAAGVANIPREIQHATYQQAIYLLKNASVIAAANARRARNMASSSEPNISYSQTSPDDGSNVMSAQALHYLAGFRVAGQAKRAGAVRSVRLTSGFVGGNPWPS